MFYIFHADAQNENEISDLINKIVNDRRKSRLNNNNKKKNRD